jgi:nitroreductase
MADLTPLLAFRWSPRAFDPTATLTAAEADSLLEAARWAPSAGNGQPWRFALGHRDDETHKRILVNLPAEERRWARHAAALLLAAHLTATEDAPSAGATEDDRSAGAAGEGGREAYDLGQAVAHLTVQATALGLHVRQIARLDRAGLAADLELPAGVRPLVVAAVGRLGDPFSLPEELRDRETGLRRRRPVAELLLR